MKILQLKLTVFAIVALPIFSNVYADPTAVALGSTAGLETWGRCNDGTTVVTLLPTACDANGGWYGNSSPSVLYGGAYTTTGNLTYQSTSIGGMALGLGQHSIAIGAETFASDNFGIAIGAYSSALGLHSISFGGFSVATGDSVAIGWGSRASTGLESYVYGAQMNGVASNSYSEFSVGNATTGVYRRITNVADGYAINDATNVEQLNSGVANAITSANAYTNLLGTKHDGSLAGVASSFGGGSAYNPVTGVFSQPAYILGATTYNDVGSALNGLLTTNTATTTALGNSTSSALGGGSAYNPATGVISAPAIAVNGTTYNNATGAIQALDNVAVKYDKNADGTTNFSSSTLAGATGTTFHNLSAGVASMDAVNVDQLNTGLTNAVTSANTYTDTKVTGLNTSITSLSTKYDSSLAGVASSLGGGATYNSTTGAFSQPSYTVGATTYNDVGAALTASTNQTDSLGNSAAAAIGGGSGYNSFTGTISSPKVRVDGTTYTNTSSAITALDNTTVKFDKNVDGSTNYDSVTLGNPDTFTTSIVHNVTAGVTGTDAVNVNQLNNVQKSTVTGLDSVATALGGGATYANSVISQPTYTIGTTTYNDVGSAFAASNKQSDSLGKSTAAAFGGGSIYDSATGAITAPTISVAGTTYNNTTTAIQALDSHAVKYDNNANGTPDYSSVTLGTTGTSATIHNLTAGVAGSDAVNVNQLNNGLNASNAYTDSQVSGLGSKTQAQIATLANQNQAQFKDLGNQIKATGSIAAAMSGLVPNYHSASKLQAQAAVGYGAGAAGVAGGMTYQIDNDTLIVGKVGISATSSTSIQNRVGMAIGVSLGL